MLKSDNGGEYVNCKLKRKGTPKWWYKTSVTCPIHLTAKDNGRGVNRIVGQILSVANFPVKYWTEAANTAVYLIIRSPAMHKKTRYKYILV